MDNEKLLTIAIPTYNRAQYLNESLKRIGAELKGFEDLVELIIADNCSPDDTAQVVQTHINMGLNLTYVRNQENIGMDRNFVQCFKLAKSKYVWVLGDDDFLLSGSIKELLGILDGNDYGLVHLQVGKNEENSFVVYLDGERLYSKISFWITFISSNIVNAKYVSRIEFEKYIGSFFTLIPLYLTALMSHHENVLVKSKIFEMGAASESNGGYNIFKVFITNYLEIVKSFLFQGEISWFRYELEKYRLYRYHLLSFIFKFQFMKSKNHNFETNGFWSILLSKYWYEPYLLPSLCLLELKKLRLLFLIGTKESYQ